MQPSAPGFISHIDTRHGRYTVRTSTPGEHWPGAWETVVTTPRATVYVHARTTDRNAVHARHAAAVDRVRAADPVGAVVRHVHGA